MLLTGALAGLTAGYIGLGGGAVLTPLCVVIYPALGIVSDDLIKIIFGTNMLLVTVFSISAVWKHHRNGNIIWRTLLIMGPLAVVGSLTGSWLASIADTGDMKRAFAIVLLISSLLIITRKPTDPAGGSKRSKPVVSLNFLPLLGFVAGVAGSFLGIGGGVIMITPLILLFKYPIEKVAGTSSSVIIFIGLAGTIGYMYHGHGIIELPGWSQGYVWLSAAIPLMIGGVPMAQVGAWLNSITRTTLLKKIFGAVLFVIAIKMFF